MCDLFIYLCICLFLFLNRRKSSDSDLADRDALPKVGRYEGQGSVQLNSSRMGFNTSGSTSMHMTLINGAKPILHIPGQPCERVRNVILICVTLINPPTPSPLSPSLPLQPYSLVQLVDQLGHRGGHEGRFSRDPVLVLPAGGPCEQF